MTLFEECVYALGRNIVILSEKQTNHYVDELCYKFLITSWGRIDWEKVQIKKIVRTIEDLNKWFDKNEINSLNVIILWNHSDSPGIKTNLRNVLQVLDDVTAVGSDTFLYNLDEGYVIEFYHEGEVTVGLHK